MRDFWLYYRVLWARGVRPIYKLPFDYISFRKRTGGSAYDYENK